MSDIKDLSTIDAAILAIKGLPPERQVEIAYQILDGVEGMDEETEAAWKAELQRRYDEVTRGEADLIPEEEALRIIRERGTV